MIQLKDYNVEIRESLTWGDKEKVQSEMLKGMKMSGARADNINFDASAMLEGKYKLLELAITKIEDKEGNEINFSRDWMDNLPAEDGDKLYEAVEVLHNVKKN